MLLKRDALEREENLKLRIEIFGFEINKQTNKHNSNSKRSLGRNLGEHRSVRRARVQRYCSPPLLVFSLRMRRFHRTEFLIICMREKLRLLFLIIESLCVYAFVFADDVSTRFLPH